MNLLKHLRTTHLNQTLNDHMIHFQAKSQKTEELRPNKYSLIFLVASVGLLYLSTKAAKIDRDIIWIVAPLLFLRTDLFWVILRLLLQRASIILDIFLYLFLVKLGFSIVKYFENKCWSNSSMFKKVLNFSNRNRPGHKKLIMKRSKHSQKKKTRSKRVRSGTREAFLDLEKLQNSQKKMEECRKA